MPELELFNIDSRRHVFLQLLPDKDIALPGISGSPIYLRTDPEGDAPNYYLLFGHVVGNCKAALPGKSLLIPLPSISHLS